MLKQLLKINLYHPRLRLSIIFRFRVFAPVTVQPGLRIHCTHRMKAQSLRATIQSSERLPAVCMVCHPFAYTVKSNSFGGSLKDYIEERAIEVASYMIEAKATVRQTAKKTSVSASLRYIKTW